MLHYPRVPPAPLYNLLKKNPSKSAQHPKPAEDLKTSVKIMEKVQDREASKGNPVRPKASDSVRSSLSRPATMLPHFNVKSHKRAVSERLTGITKRDRRIRSRRHRRRRNRAGKHRSRLAREPPAAPQNPQTSQQSAPGNQALNQSHQPATPEPYIETVQKIDLPMTASGNPKLMDDVTVMEKEGNITLSQAEKQIPLNLPASSAAAGNSPSLGTASPAVSPGSGQPPQAQDQSSPQGNAVGQAAPVPPQGSLSPAQSGQESGPNAVPSGSLSISQQDQLPGSPVSPQQPGQAPLQPAGQPAEQTPVQSPVQPQDQPPPPQPAAAPGSGQKTGANDGLIIDEDVKVEDGGASAPVEKKLHFPQAPGAAQSGNQNQAPASSGSNTTNGTDANGVSIDEDIKVDEGDPAHPVEEELRYPPGGKPTVVGGSAKNSSLGNPANLRDPSALHHDMPSENAPLDEMPKTKAPPTDGKSQDGDKIQITSETVSKVVQNPKTEAVRDPSGLEPPKSNAPPPGLVQKESSDEKIDEKRENSPKTPIKDFPRDLSGANMNSGKRYPEVRILGNLQPLPKTSLPSEVAKTVNTVDETLRLQPKTSEQSQTYDAGTFYLSPTGNNGASGAKPLTSLKSPVGVNLKIFVNQKPTNVAAPVGVGSAPVEQIPAPAKNRRMIIPEPPAVADAYDYDLSELPSWMQRAAAVKRSVDSPSSSAELSLPDQGTAVEDEQSPASLPGASRPVRTAGHVSDPQSDEMKRALAAPRVQKIFQSAREQLMKLLGGPQETLDSEIDTLLGKRQSDNKDKRENDMKLRLDSSSLTSYPEQGLDPL